MMFGSGIGLAQTTPPTSGTRSTLPLAVSEELQKRAQPDQVIYLLEQSAETENNDVGLSRSMIELAAELATTSAERLKVLQHEQAFVMRRGEYERGLQLAQTILDLTEELNLPRDTFRAHISMARALRLVGDASDALRALQHALELSQNLDEVEPDLVRAYSMMASVYRRQSQFESAAASYEQALAIARENHLEQLQFRVLANQSLVLMELGRFAEAQQTLEMVLAHHEAAGNRLSAASARFNLAAIAHHTGDPAAAVRGFEGVLQDYLDLDSKGREANTRLALAEIHLEQNNLPAAIAQLEAAQPVVEASGNLSHQTKLQRLQIVAQAATGDIVAAVATSQRFIELNDELVGTEVKRDIERLRAKAELARKDTQLAQAARDRALANSALDHAAAELTKTRTRYLTFAIAVIALGLAGLSVLLVRRRAERRILAETELARTAAEEANELKTRLLAIASHDLKSPLTNITLSADQMVSFPEDREFSLESAQRILNQSRHMSRLISELLDLSALEIGRLELQLKPCRLADLLTSNIAEHLANAERKNIRLESHLDPALATTAVTIDRNRIEQVINNLLSNALKFTPLGGKVRVELTSNDRHVQLMVKDTGPGFTVEDLAQAFRPFHPLSARTTAGESSSGLGLHIAREIVQLHGGTLEIVSPPGQSAMIRLELPLA